MIKVGDTVKYVGPVTAYMGLSCGKVIMVRMGHIVVVKWPCLSEPVIHSSSALSITNQEQTEPHSGESMCNCERDYDTRDGHALDCTIHNATASVNTIEGVTKPSHYMLFDDIEAIEVLARSMTREQFKGYCFGNILKYRLRAGKKSELAYLEKDMAKAGFYGELYEKHKDKCYDA